MEWFSQNWIWVVLLAVAGAWFLSRARHGTLMGGSGHGMAHEGPQGEPKPGEANADKSGQAAGSSRHHHGCC